MISGEVGMHKPQPEIYLLACERLGIEPADGVFVDDLRENCDGAEAVGMTAILTATQRRRSRGSRSCSGSSSGLSCTSAEGSRTRP